MVAPKVFINTTGRDSNRAFYSPDDFSRHFQEKIERIRLSTAEFFHPTITSRNVDNPLDVFEPVSVEDVVTMMRKSPSKQCSLDLMPTWLLKNVCEFMAPIIAPMCNASISQNRFPVNQETAVARSACKCV